MPIISETYNENQLENKECKQNAIFIRSEKKLPEDVKKALKNYGSHWDQDKRVYSIPLQEEESVKRFLGDDLQLERGYDPYHDLSPELQKAENLKTSKGITEEKGLNEINKINPLIASFNADYDTKYTLKTFIEIENSSSLENLITSDDPREMPRLESIYEEVSKIKAAQEKARNHGAKAQSLKEKGEQKKPESAFKFVSLADMLSEPPKSRWIVKDYLDEGSLSCIFGEPGAMKSFLAIDLGASVASGRNWHGNKIRKSGPVFYICGEGHGGLKRRFRAWTLHHDRSANIPFFISETPAQVLDGDHFKTVVAAFEELRGEHGKPVLVIIDTLNRNFGPGDENSTEDMTLFIARIDTFMRSVGCAVMIVHHSGLSDKERARGASALRAALDWEFRLTKKTDGEREFTCTKCKDYEEPLPMSFKPKTIPLTGWTDEDTGEELTSCILEKCEAAAEEKKSEYIDGPEKLAYKILCELSEDPEGAKRIYIKEWREIAYKKGISPSENKGTKQKAFKRAVTNLREKKLIETDDDFYWPTHVFMGPKSGHDEPKKK